MCADKWAKRLSGNPGDPTDHMPLNLFEGRQMRKRTSRGGGTCSNGAIHAMKRMHQREGERGLAALGLPRWIPQSSVIFCVLGTSIPMLEANHYLSLE